MSPSSSKPVKRLLLGVRLPAQMVKQVRETADARGMKVQGLVEQALRYYLQHKKGA